MKLLPRILVVSRRRLAASAAARSGPITSRRPPRPSPAHYKDMGNWKPASPQDAVVRGKWWEIYHDPELNALEEKIDISNQNVLEAEANFREAAAAVKVARADLFPHGHHRSGHHLHPDPAAGREQRHHQFGRRHEFRRRRRHRGGGRRRAGHRPPPAPTTCRCRFPISPTSGARCAAASRTARPPRRASFALLENARLSYQATLAQDYFSLRGLDAEAKLLNDTVVSLPEISRTHAKTRYNSGVASRGDVAAAQTQLDQTRAQLIDLGVSRAQYSDAIATSSACPPPASASTTRRSPPNRRACRRACPPRCSSAGPTSRRRNGPWPPPARKSACRVAGYYPQVTLSGSAGLDEIALADVFSGPNILWSAGPAIAQTIFDAGRTTAWSRRRARPSTPTSEPQPMVTPSFSARRKARSALRMAGVYFQHYVPGVTPADAGHAQRRAGPSAWR